MGILKNPKLWVPLPNINPRDCSQHICTLFCPELCYLIRPPPPPPPSSLSFPLNASVGSTFSPLVVTIIGVLSSAFLLVTYYLILTKYCRNSNPSRRVEDHHPPLQDHDDDADVDHDHNEIQHHEPWVITTIGLDETLIKSIPLVRYRKEGGVFSGDDCPVCLGEFQEDDSLRLLPKCSHAFHVECIDTWLRSHSNCPLCRANVFSTTAQPPPLPPPLVVEDIPEPETQVGNREEDEVDGDVSDPHVMIRRSISMDDCRVSISDSMSSAAGESSKFSSAMNYRAVNRSFSSGRLFFFTKNGRGRNL